MAAPSVGRGAAALNGLQWGHGREAMDGGRRRRGVRGQVCGLQWGHGREAMDGCRPNHARAAPMGFNGAMAVRPWMVCGSKLPEPAVRLQWGHGREAMDGVRLAGVTLGGKGFNGAMAVRPWMGKRPRHDRLGRRPASMGPWP